MRLHALKGLALPRLSHCGEIALAGSRRLRSTLAAAPAFSRPLLPHKSRSLEQLPRDCMRALAVPVCFLHLLTCECLPLNTGLAYRARVATAIVGYLSFYLICHFSSVVVDLSACMAH